MAEAMGLCLDLPASRTLAGRQRTQLLQDLGKLQTCICERSERARLEKKRTASLQHPVYSVQS